MIERSTQEVIDRTCTGKHHHEKPIDARREAERLRRKGGQMSAYRCPFCSAGWCVGHVPSVEGMTQLALAIRDRGGDRPPARPARKDHAA